MTECNAIIKANNEIDKLKRENEKLNELCVQYGFEMGKLEEENEHLKQELTEQVSRKDACLKTAHSFKVENEQLKSELKVYRKIASCRNCEHHGYDWFADGEEFEVCDKGNDVTEGICEEWEGL